MKHVTYVLMNCVIIGLCRGHECIPMCFPWIFADNRPDDVRLVAGWNRELLTRSYDPPDPLGHHLNILRSSSGLRQIDIARNAIFTAPDISSAGPRQMIIRQLTNLICRLPSCKSVTAVVRPVAGRPTASCRWMLDLSITKVTLVIIGLGDNFSHQAWYRGDLSSIRYQ